VSLHGGHNSSNIAAARQHVHCGRSFHSNWNGDWRNAAGGGDVAADPLLKLLPDICAQAQESNATALLGSVGPHDLPFGLNRRMTPRKSELEVAQVAFNDGPDDLAAQSPFANVEKDSAAIRPKSDVGQLIQSPARVCATLGAR
jgi:hypothetical protein